MLYQAILCLAQTALTLYVCSITGIQFPKEGLFTPWLIVDLGITIFLVTYASDMLSLWISCLCHSTTTAMTVMPFVLIFQLVFSGGIFSLPAWANKLSVFSISNYSMKCIAAQSNYNGLPLVTAWNSLVKVEDREINATVSLGEVMDFLSDDSKELVHDIRETGVVIPSAEELITFLAASQQTDQTFDVLSDVNELAGLLQPAEDSAAEAERETVMLGSVIDTLAESDYIQEQRDLSYTIRTTISRIIDTIGREKTKTYIQEQTALSNRNDFYENTKENISGYWFRIGLFAAGFAVLSVVFLEFIDKDKR